jgi:hypothetical protein
MRYISPTSPSTTLLTRYTEMYNALKSVCYTLVMDRREHKVRNVTSRGTPSYQLGHYEMTGEKGKRRSVFKVDVHLGEHQTPEQALAVWPEEVSRLQAMGRESKAEKLQSKLDRLQELTQRG